jgi:hypothetical protein
MHTPKAGKSLLFTVVVILASTFIAEACNVPVFRYALERWPADPYEIIMFRRGPLAEGEAALAGSLERQELPGALHANYVVRDVDLDGQVPDVMRELFERIGGDSLPRMAIRYPGTSEYRLALWSGPISEETVTAALDSPVRRTVRERILDGQSAVWVLLESGNAAKDDEAARFIERTLTDLESTLKLPDAIDGNSALSPVDLSHGPDVRISFSVVRLSRTDPAERVFIDMLMHSEPDLNEYLSEPMVFPVYGRGRALYALVGAGITEENIGSACSFLTGACSCEVKALNPGVDILMTVDWDSGLGESWIVDEELPPLTGIAGFAEASVAQEAAAVEAGGSQAGMSTSAPAPETVPPATAMSVRVDTGSGAGKLMRNMLATLGIVLIGVAAFAVGVTRTRKKRG